MGCSTQNLSLKKAKGMLCSLTDVGRLGHPLPFTWISVKEPLTRTSARKPDKHKHTFVSRKTWLVQSRVQGKGEKKGLLIVQLLVWQRGTYSSNAAALQKNNQNRRKMSYNAPPPRKPMCCWFLYLQLWIPLLWMIKGEKNVTWPNPGILCSCYLECLPDSTAIFISLFPLWEH